MANGMTRRKSEQWGPMVQSSMVTARANPLESRTYTPCPYSTSVNAWWARTMIVLFLVLLPSNLEIGEKNNWY